MQRKRLKSTTSVNGSEIDHLRAVASSDQCNGGGPKDLVRSSPSQVLSRSAVELVDHGLDVIGVVLG
jgi:hypothetical protein